MWHLAIPAGHLVVRALVIYLALFTGLRLFGKREVGQFTLFDLVLVLLVANAVQPAVTGPDSSLLGGLVIMAALFAVNGALALLRMKSPLVRHLLSGHPTVLAQEGHWLPAALRREGVNEDDCLVALREHGLSRIEDVRLAVLEPDGTISVVPAGNVVLRSSHRVRMLRRS